VVVAADIEDDVRRSRCIRRQRAAVGLAAPAPRGELQARDHPRATAHGIEVLVGRVPDFGVAKLRLHRDPRHVDHEARIDP
jgi:hypothetical protein